MDPESAAAARHRPHTLGHELALVIRGYLVDPQQVTDDRPTWDEMLHEINQRLRNPIFYNFNNLDLVRSGDAEALITDATGRVVARVELERPGRVRTIPLDD